MLPTKLLTCAILGTVANGLLHPVIMIPGDGGSRIEARITKTRGSSAACYWKFWKGDWFELWLNWYFFMPKMFDCWVENMRLR